MYRMQFPQPQDNQVDSNHCPMQLLTEKGKVCSQERCRYQERYLEKLKSTAAHTDIDQKHKSLTSLSP